MKKSLRTEIKSLLHDDEEFVKESGCETIAEYLINSTDPVDQGWSWFFDDEETSIEITASQIEEVKMFLNKNYNIKIEDYYE